MSIEAIDSKTLAVCKTCNLGRMTYDSASILSPGSSCSHDNLSRNNVQRRQRLEIEQIDIVKLINQGKFSVFLAEVNSRKFAMKLFTKDNKDAEGYFQNEIRFAFLNHPNIVKMIHYASQMEFQTDIFTFKTSFILTEYAPYGDFLDLLETLGSSFDDKLIRTYFHQLIEGLEYLHSQNVVHLDIKLENLLIGNEFLLKIADFDTSSSTKDPVFLGKGTKCFRAPEILSGDCRDGPASDIYSAGVVLFAMKNKGYVPHLEAKKFEGIDLQDLLWNKNIEFWTQHCRIQQKESSFFSDEFKELVNGMLKKKPEERLTISQIKSTKWYSEPVYSHEELKKIMKILLLKEC